MKKRLAILTVFVFGLVLYSSSAMAYDFGTNITISDQNYTNQSWHQDQEDEEVEPGMQHGQIWDLEGFFLDGDSLSIVGGYDFVNGHSGYLSGDLFIDVTDDAVFGDIDGTMGNGNFDVANTFGYDYVLDFEYDAVDNQWDYTVYEINGQSRVLTAFYQQNQGSSPWRYASGGTEVTGANGSANYLTGLSNEDVGFLGGEHNVINGIDLSFLGDNINNFTASFTMGCGNDHLMGDPVPEPSTIILLGFGILGLVGFRKKFGK